MLIRDFWILVGAMIVLAVGTALYGDRFFLGFFVIFAAIGIAVTLWSEVILTRVTRLLRRRSELAQEQTLLLLEDAAARHDLATRLGRTAPPVPLRAPMEVYRFPAEAVRPVRWVMWMSATMALVIAMIPLLDPTASWWEMGGLAVAFAAGAWLMKYQAVAVRSWFEITETEIRHQVFGGTPRVIAWSDVREARHSTLGQALSIRSAGRNIVVPNTVEGYGRLVNLVASRLPPTARWIST